MVLSLPPSLSLSLSHTHMHACMHPCTRTNVHTQMHTQTHTHAPLYTHTHTHICSLTLSSLAPSHAETSPSAEPAPTQQPPEDQDKVPHRRFMCVHWELNPHLLLLSAISGQFNPHISWLLETLGFKDARTTIPKWIQRGAMDPLDMVIANLVELLVTVSAKKKLQLRVLSPLPPDASGTAK